MNTIAEHSTFSDTDKRFPWIWMSPTVLHATLQSGSAYSVNPSTRILIDDERLRTLAIRLAAGLTGATKLVEPPQILLVPGGNAQAGANDIELRFATPDTADVAIPVHGKDETYRIDVTSSIRVTAQNLGAMARALTTLHKAVRVSTVLDPAVIIDAPVYAERSVMIDMGRRQFSPEWMICLIQEMAWNQLNTLHLHLTDNEGVRVIFPSHPDISSDDAWSAADLKRVLDTAASYHIEVIPELDMPGHMNWILRDRPQWQLKLSNGSVVSKAIDFSLAEARSFLKSLFADLMEMFPQSRYVHLGADEFFLSPIAPANTPQLAQYVYDATGISNTDSEDAVRFFVNDIAKLVQEKGKVARVWNDSFVKRRQLVTLDKQVQIECWSIWGSARGDLNVQELVDAGYTVLNAHGDFYFIINEKWDNLFHAKHSPHGIYDVWRANRFMDKAGGAFTEIPVDSPAMAGAGIQLWIEVATFSSPEEMWTQLRSWLLPLGQRTWDSANAASRFKELSLIARAVANPPPVPWW